MTQEPLTNADLAAPQGDEGIDTESPIYNRDLAPATADQRQWSTYSLFAFWSNTSHNLGAYTFAAGLFALGLNAWEIVAGILLASVVVYAGCLLSGEMGRATGVPFPVISRLSWGIYGANIPAMIRGFAAIGWYGIQTFLAAAALDAIFDRFVPFMAPLRDHQFLGLNGLSWVSFLILWALQLLILSRGMEIIRHVQGWSGGVIWAVLLLLGVYMLIRSGGQISFTENPVHLSAGQQALHFFQILGLLMGIVGTLMLNYADFTRFAPDKKSVRHGTMWGVPANWTLFALTSVILSLGSLSVFGKSLLNPADIFEQLSNPVLMLVGALLLIFAAIGVNIVANFVSPAFDISNLAPKKISFRLGGLITALVALASLPWKLYSTPVVINYFLGALGAMIGPLFGIMVVDYFWLRRARVSIPDLYNTSSFGRYYYRKGFNPKTLQAFVPSAIIAILVAVLPALQAFAPFAWYVGTALAGGIYAILVSRERSIIEGDSM